MGSESIFAASLAAALALGAGLARAGDDDERLRSAAAPYEEIVHVTVRQGVDEPVLLSMAAAEQKPKRILMLFPGGDGVMRLRAEPGGVRFRLSGNYLLRSRALFVDAEDAAVSLDMPGDQYCCANDRFRLGGTHVADVGRIVGALAARFPGAQLYLVGTSRGTVSVAPLAVALGPSVAGAVMTSTVTQPSRSGEGLSGFDFGTLKTPTLFVHHRDDNCRVTPYAAVRDLAAKYRFPLVTVTGSSDTSGPACQAYSAHGFRGRETQVAAAIMQWVKTRAVAPAIE